MPPRLEGPPQVKPAWLNSVSVTFFKNLTNKGDFKMSDFEIG
jgi:hypothetical protein